MRIAPRIMYLVLLAAASASCGEGAGAPTKLGERAALTIVPRLASGSVSPAALHAVSASVDNVRLRVTRADGGLLLDSTVIFPAEESSVTIDAQLPVELGAGGLNARIQLRSGQLVLFEGTGDVASRAPDDRAPPTEIPVTYAGPGRSVAQLVIAPRDTTISAGAAFDLRLAAFDSSEKADSAIAPYIYWSVSDPALATIDAGGRLAPSGHRGTIVVRAETPTGIVDSARIGLVPPPASIEFTTQPQGGVVNTVLPPVVVTVHDAFGAPATTSVPVTLSVVPAPGTDAATLGGTTTKSLDANGTATFDDLQLDLPGTGYALRATLGNLPPATSQAFDVAGGTIAYQNFCSARGLVLYGTSSITSDCVLRLTPDQGNSSAGSWSTAKLALGGGFETTFQFRVTPADTSSSWRADGFAFVIQNAATNAVGAAGGGLGYAGIPTSVAVEFDTWQNPGPSESDDPNNNHVAVNTLGRSGNTTSHTQSYTTITATPSFTISDGQVHTARVVYTVGQCAGVAAAPGGWTLQLFLDGDAASPPVLCVPINLQSVGPNGDDVLDAQGRAWVGFTAGTGAASEAHDILSWALQPATPAARVLLP